jgi:molecular chaperone GrpE
MNEPDRTADQAQGQQAGQQAANGAGQGAANDAGQAPHAHEVLGSASVGDVEQDLQTALAKANENYDLYLRAKAEGENIRRRAQDDIAKASKYAIESFAEHLVPVMDSLDKALRSRTPPPSSCARVWRSRAGS